MMATMITIRAQTVKIGIVFFFICNPSLYVISFQSDYSIVLI
jgi:hypothetical protein